MQENRDEKELAEKIQARRIIRSKAKTSEEGRKAAKRLNITPSETEIIWEWSKIKERALGEDEDGVRIIYLKAAQAHFQAKVASKLYKLSSTHQRDTDDMVEVGLITSARKGREDNNPDSFRGVCLLPMGSPC